MLYKLQFFNGYQWCIPSTLLPWQLTLFDRPLPIYHLWRQSHLPVLPPSVISGVQREIGIGVIEVEVDTKVSYGYQDSVLKRKNKGRYLY